MAANPELSRLLQARVDHLTSNLYWKLGEVALLLAVTMAVLVFIARGITKTLTGLTAGMRKLAEGDFHAVLPGLGLSDEIGEIARAVEVFKVKAEEKARLEASERAARHAKEAEAQAALAREREKVAAEQANAIQKIAAAVLKLAQKDLTFRMNERLPEAYERIRAEFNEAIGHLEQAIGQVASTARAVTGEAREISKASSDLARRTADQASILEETSAALSGVSDNVNQAASGATQAEQAVKGAQLDANRGAEIVKNAIQSMSCIEASSGQIRNIISVIDEIAFQTNLLALNAGVEAARAGDAGRGFAVVASEVRALAQRSAEAAKEIKQLVSKSAAEVGEGVAMVTDTGKALDTINSRVTKISNFVTGIVANSKDQAGSLGENQPGGRRYGQADAGERGDVGRGDGCEPFPCARERDVGEPRRSVSRGDDRRRRLAAPTRGRRAARVRYARSGRASQAGESNAAQSGGRRAFQRRRRGLWPPFRRSGRTCSDAAVELEARFLRVRMAKRHADCLF